MASHMPALDQTHLCHLYWAHKLPKPNPSPSHVSSLQAPEAAPALSAGQAALGTLGKEGGSTERGNCKTAAYSINTYSPSY